MYSFKPILSALFIGLFGITAYWPERGMAAEGSTALQASRPEVQELADTLRDMIAWQHTLEFLAGRLFTTPQEIAAHLSPRSQWGRQRLEERKQAWDEALTQLVAGLTQRGELGRASGTDGLRIPVLSRVFEEVPEYHPIDHLVSNVDLKMCDQDADEAKCYLVLYLHSGDYGQMELVNVRIVDADGALVELAGKAQR